MANQAEKIIYLKEYMSGDFAYDGGLPEKKGITKFLGGKSIVRMTRYWSYHGIGGWIYEWLVNPKNLSKVKESVESFGYSLVLEKWDKEKEKYYSEVY